MQPKVSVLSGPLGNSEFRFSGAVSIGRDASNEVCIEDASVSPHHCQIVSENGQYLLTDLGSASGTFVNGIPVARRVLAAGDQIAVGISLLTFQLEGAPKSASHRVKLDKISALRGNKEKFVRRHLCTVHSDCRA